MLVLIVLSYAKMFGQNNDLLGSIQVSQMLDYRTYPSDIGFHYANQVSLCAQIPLYINSTTSKELLSMEIRIGGLVNSMYFKSTKNRGSGGVRDGFLIKAEPILNIYENKSKTLFFQACVNNFLYLFPKYESSSGAFSLDSNEVILKTTNSNSQLQYAVEPRVGFSYVLKFKENN